MVDPLESQNREACGDVGSRGVLALVAGQPETGGARRLVTGKERGGVDPQLGGVHAHADHPVSARGAGAPQRNQLLDESEPGHRAERSVHVTDQQAGRVRLSLSCGYTLVEPCENLFQAEPCCQVTGGREEALLMNDTVSRTVQDRLVAQPGPVSTRR